MSGLSQATSAALYNAEDLAIIEQLMIAEARAEFWAFRQFMRPRMVLGWWLEDEAANLQQFFVDFIAGKRPIMVLGAPPQHGKTWSITDFIAWCIGKIPSLAAVFASYSDRLGQKVNMDLQRLMETERYQQVFPGAKLPRPGDRMHVRNSSTLEIVNTGGVFRNTTVNGPINGEGFRLGVVDDPIKGRKEASSKTVREGTWNWMTDDFYARFTDDGALLLIMTRWHVDDPAGRMLAHFPNVKVVTYEAIATQDERYRKAGEALFPQFKSLEFLEARRNVLSQASWASLYQQKPIIVGGGMFPIEKFQDFHGTLDQRDIVKSVRYWDKAGTEGAGANSASVLMHRLSDGRFVIEHVAAGQWGSLKREKIIKRLAEIDNKFRTVDIWVEQEPGSGGKESAESTIRSLAGFNAYADKVTGDKVTRADPYAAQVQGGNVYLMPGDWHLSFLDEHEVFPNGPHKKDRVDAAAGAFAKLTVGFTYDTSMNWVGG